MKNDTTAIARGFGIDPQAIVEGFEAAVMRRDVDAAMGYFHPNVLVSVHYHDLALPFAGSTMGVEMARDRLVMVFRDWTFLERKATLHIVNETTVRSRVACVIQHNRTRAKFDFTFRETWKIADGRIISCEHWSDFHLIKSFLRLIETFRAPVALR